MACVALSSLIGSIEIEFLQPTPRVSVSPHDQLPIISLLANLYSLQALLQKESSGEGDGDAIRVRDLEIQIRDFALKSEDHIQIQLSNILLAQHTGICPKNKMKISGQPSDLMRFRATHELHQILRGAAKNSTALLKIITTGKALCGSEREMASAALTILITKFKYYIFQHFPTMYLRDEAAMKSSLWKLDSLQSFLLRRKSNCGAAIKIRDFALKAENDIEIQLSNFLLSEDTEHEEEASQELRQTLQEVVEIAAEIIDKEEQQLLAEYLKIVRGSRSNEVDDEANETQPLKHADADASKSANVVESDGDGSSSSHGFLKPEGRMVGGQHDCTVIKDQLLSSRFGVKIISVVGMVGIGKTTVARNVYEDPSVASHFDVRAWVTIPQHYNKSRMLSDLLQSIMAAEPNVIKKRGTSDELGIEMQVRKRFLGRRYLLVLDNTLGHHQAWNDIRECVSNDIGGSCILQTTSRFNRRCSWNEYIHKMTLLDPKESWELFCSVLSIEEHLAPKIEKIRNHVVEKCDGLPQLIVEVAKRLSKCNNIEEGWKKIEKELESLGILDRNALFFSYYPLPHHLKICFLYFGVFPKRNRILVTMLIRLWIAEGFVMKPLEHRELEDQAYEYLLELIDRSLILIENQSFDGKIKTCRMHSALHSFCVVEAQKEGIFCALNTKQHSGLSLDAFANSCRWLSLYSHSFDYYVLFSTNIPRSIFIFLENPENFVRLKLLRVLAFDTSISLQRVPVQLGDLVFLRYLSITQWFEDLDDVVSNNPNLETLVVSGNGAPTVHLPSSIWKPPHLRHLELGNSYMVDPPSADKKNLQTLSWVVRPLHCIKKTYSRFPNIKNLKIFLKDDIEPYHIGGTCSNPIILDDFDYLEGLEKLSISVSIGCNAALPKQCMYPTGLKKLKLSGTNISERDLNVIAMLPKLMVLKLENAFHGTIWNVVAPGGFRQLIFLLLEAKELKQWVVSFGCNFWRLKHLVLRSCNCLKQMPKDFKGYNLQSIELEGCHSSLVASAKHLQQKSRLKNLKIKILDPKFDEY